MSPPPQSAFPLAVAHTVAAVVAATLTVTVVVLWMLRINYPFELEWMEGLVLDQIARAAGGEAMYTQPTMNYVPLLYGPLYFEAAALVGRLGGFANEFFAPRLVSASATLATFGMLAALIVRASGSALSNKITCICIGVGIYAGTYPVVSTWFDIARVDSLFLALAVAAVMVLLFSRSLTAAAFAGLVLSASYFTKQSGLLLMPPLAVSTLFATQGGWRAKVSRAGTFAASFAIPTLAIALILDATTDGWFHYYTLTMPAQHKRNWDALGGFWLFDIPVLAPALSVGVLGLFLLARSRGVNAALSRTAWTAGFFAIAMLSRVHQGGDVNVLMPAYFATAFLCGTGLLETSNRGVWIRGLSVGLTSLQLVLLSAVLAFPSICHANLVSPTSPELYPNRLIPGPAIFHIRGYVPTAEDRAANERLVAILEAVEGTVYLPNHGYLARSIGKEPLVHMMALMDIYRGAPAEDQARFGAQFLAMPSEFKIDVIVLPDDPHPPFPALVGGFEYAGSIVDPTDKKTMMPVAGLTARPLRIYERRRGIVDRSGLVREDLR